MLIGKRPKTRGIHGVLALILPKNTSRPVLNPTKGIKLAAEKVVADRP